MNLDSGDHLVAETVAWIHALILAWIKGRFWTKVMANNLHSCDPLVVKQSFWPRPYLIMHSVEERGKPWQERLSGKFVRHSGRGSVTAGKIHLGNSRCPWGAIYAFHKNRAWSSKVPGMLMCWFRNPFVVSLQSFCYAWLSCFTVWNWVIPLGEIHPSASVLILILMLCNTWILSFI